MNRYISGMKEIQAGDELKKQMIHHVQQQSARKCKTLSIKKTATLSAAALMIAFLAVLGASFMQHKNKKIAFIEINTVDGLNYIGVVITP